MSYAGLKNKGATCYMNSLLQVFFMIPEFRKELFKLTYEITKHGIPEDFIPYQLQLLFGKLAMRKSISVDTIDLIKSFKWERSEMFVQHDAHEFARILFEALEVSFEEDTPGSFDKLNQLFMGESINYISCEECPYESMRMEKWLDLQMVIQDPFQNVKNSRLEQCLELYIKPELLHGENKYSCEDCKKKVNAKKGVKLFRLPEVLVMNLQRFYLNMQNFQRVKSNNFVSFPLVLNLNNYINGYEGIKDHFPDQDPEKIPENDLGSNNGENKIPVKPKKYQNIKSSNSTREFLKQMRKKNQTEANNDKKGSEFDEEIEIVEPKIKPSPHPSSSIPEPSLTIGKAKPQQETTPEGEEPSGIPAPPPPILIQSLEMDRAEKMHRQRFEAKPAPVPAIPEEASGSSNIRVNISKPRSQRYRPNLPNPRERLFQGRFLDQYTKPIQEQIDEYLKEGDLVYELIAVVNHIGSAYSGHYYSFIKSFEDGKWYEFNDTNVTPITLDSMCRKAFGMKEIGSSGYMLFYRKYSPIPVGEVSIPEEIKNVCEEAIKEQEKKEAERQLETVKHLIENGKFKISVYYKMSCEVFSVDTTAKLEEFLKEIKQKFGFLEEKEENVRFRRYNPSKDMMLNSFEGKGTRTLIDLGISPEGRYAIERKGDGEEFEEFDPSLKKYKIFIWPQTSQEMTEGQDMKETELESQVDLIRSTDSLENNPSFFVTIDSKKTVIEFETKIREKILEFKQNLESKTPEEQQKRNQGPSLAYLQQLIDSDHLYILRRALLDGYQKTGILLNAEDTIQYSLDEVKLYESSMVLIELGSRLPMKSNFLRLDESLWKQVLERESNQCTLKYNEPSMHKNSVVAQYQNELVVDSRKTMGEVKRELAQILDIELEKFLIKKGGKMGIELKDQEKTMVKYGFRKTAHIYLEFGTPTLPGQIKLRILKSEPIKGEPFDHTMIPLAEVAVDKNATTSEVIDLAKTTALIDSEIDLSTQIFRLRDKRSRSLTKCFKSGTLRTQGVHDGKQIVMEPIDPEVQLDSIPANHFLVNLVWLDASQLQFEKIEEVVVKRGETFQEFYAKMKEFFALEGEIGDYSISYTFDVWRLDELFCMNLNFHKLDSKGMQVSGSPFFIGNDGGAIIIKKSAEKFRELTPQEKSLYESSSKYKFSGTETTYDFRALKISSVKRRKEKGIRIFARRSDKEKAMKAEQSKKNNEQEKEKVIPEEKPDFEYADMDLEELFQQV